MGGLRNADGASDSDLRVRLLCLMNAHVHHGVARAEQVAHEVVFGCGASCLLHQILVKVDSGDFAARENASNEGQLKGYVVAASYFI